MFDEIIAPLLTTEWGRRAGWGVMICMAVLLFVTVIETLSTWHSDFVITRTQHGPNKSISMNELTKLITKIPDEHIFGKYGALSGVPVTSLQLRLIGVIKSVPEKDSRVIISESGQPGKVYQVGDILSSGVKIYSIAPDGVILDNGGRLEKLPLRRSPLNFQGKPKALLPSGTGGNNE